MKQLMMCVVAAMAIGAKAETDYTVKVTKFHQSYPYSGKATVEYTVDGLLLPANVVAEITISTDDTSATFKQKGIVSGENTFTVDFASSFGGALVLTNASFMVTIAEEELGDDLGGVQLWKNGPYWAECNVGATKPEEYGYYFWWGDTVGYSRSGGTWTANYYGYTNVTWVASSGERMSSSPFSSSSCPTYGKNNTVLRSEGYIDSTGNLVAAHDAATAHLGSPWRMPTSSEVDALFSDCTAKWDRTNGVWGVRVTGKGNFANRSIFLPASGSGCEATLGDTGGDYYYQYYCYYWSSTPCSGDYSAYCIYSHEGGGAGGATYIAPSTGHRRLEGLAVRPVRGPAE